MLQPLLAEGEFALVRDYLGAASSLPISSRGFLFHDNELYSMYVELAVQQRDMPTLRQYVPLAEKTAIRDGHILYQAVAHRAWGVQYHLQNEYEKADARLAQALELFEGLATRWQIGRTHYELGELHRSMANVSEAQDNYSRALAAFEEMGAMPDIARTQTALQLLFCK